MKDKILPRIVWSGHFYVYQCFIILLIFAMIFDNVLILDHKHPNRNNLTMQAANTAEGIENYKQNYLYYIYIDLDICRLFVYKKGELIKTYPCSGGKAKTPSPLGTWKIFEKGEWGGNFGGFWLGLNIPWGVFGIHGTLYPWFIGKTNASNGCIRLLNEDAEELYEIVPVGTIVTIVQNTLEFRTMKEGNIGFDVKEAQEYLIKLGYYNAKADGRFSIYMEECVKKFQLDNNIKTTGMIGILTITKLKELINLSNQKES